MLRWVKIEQPRLGAIQGNNGCWYVLQEGGYVLRADDVGSQWYEQHWDDVKVEAFDG